MDDGAIVVGVDTSAANFPGGCHHSVHVGCPWKQLDTSLPNVADLENWAPILWRRLAVSKEVVHSWCTGGLHTTRLYGRWRQRGLRVFIKAITHRTSQKPGRSISSTDSPKLEDNAKLQIALNGPRIIARRRAPRPAACLTGRRATPVGVLVGREAGCLVVACAFRKQESRIAKHRQIRRSWKTKTETESPTFRLVTTPHHSLFPLPSSHFDTTSMYDTFGFDVDDGGFSLTSLLDVGLGDAFEPEFSVSLPRVKLPKTTPLDLEMELSSTQTPVVGSWALGSPVRRRASLSRSASLEFAFGKVKGLKRDASLDKIFVAPGRMATWGQDSSASSATDAPAAAPAPTAPTVPASPVVAPPVSAVLAPPAVAPAAPVTASAAPTQPETAPAPPKNKNKRKSAQKKGRKAQAEEDAEDDAAATAQSNTKTARAAGTTQRSGAAATRAPAASSQAPAASSQAPSASTRASKSTARAPAADDAAPSAPKTTSMAARQAAKAQRAMQSLMDASIEVALGANGMEATSANASGNANAITQDAANITPSPTRTPPPASTIAPALAPAGALDRVAASPQKASRKDECAINAQADVNERATTAKGEESSNLRAHVGVTKILQSPPATQSSMFSPTDEPPYDAPTQQLPPAPMQSVPVQSLAHYAPPALAHGHPTGQVPQSVDAAPRTRARAHGDVQLTPPRMQTMPDIDAFYIAPPANAFYPPHAPAYQGPVVPAPWYHNVVLAAQPHALINGQPMLPSMMPPPPPTMYAPQVQHLTNAPAPVNGAYHVQQASSTQHGLWMPPNHPTSTAPPAPAPYYNMGAPPSGASGPAYPPMRVASGASSSRVTTYVDGNGMARAMSPLPLRASASSSSGVDESQARTTSYASRRSHSGLQAFANAACSAPTVDLPESVMKVLRNNSKYAGGIAQLQALSAPQIPLCTAAPTIKFKVANGMKRKGVHAEPDCVECKLNHGSSGVRVHCGYSFVIDRSRKDWMEKTQDMVLEHLGFASLSLVYDTCKWEGCDDCRPHPCNKHGLGPHILDKHILKELEDPSGPPAPKRARHN
ncbi:hypothetical protein EV715DRAFT_263953 [Schizophyllum commune]